MTKRRHHPLVAMLIALDVFVNVRLLNGWRHETISSRCGKAQFRTVTGRYERGDWVWLCLGELVDFLFFWDGGTHCRDHIQEDVGRPYPY